MFSVYPRRGFTLIELLVVIAIIAILAAILFPVFAKAREKARQTQCLNNQRQIATAIMMYAQDHEETFPTADNVWGGIGVDAGVLKCPTKARLTNGYGFNMKWSGAALGDAVPADTSLLVADGAHAATVATVSNPATEAGNVLYTDTDVERRHGGCFLAAYVDGHVEMSTKAKVLTAPGDLAGLPTFSTPGPLTWVSGSGITVHPAPCASMAVTAQGWDSWVGGNTPNGAIDGSLAAGANTWTLGYAATPTWIQIDLGSVQKVGAVRFWGGVTTFGSTRTTKDADIYVDNTAQANNSAWVAHGTKQQAATSIPNSPDGAPSSIFYLYQVPQGRYVTISSLTKYDGTYVGFGEIGVAIVP